VNRQEDKIDIYYNSFEYFRKLEKSLAESLGLSELKSGGQVIRNDKGWRENEKSIDYIWVVQISRSFIGWGGLFSIKFNENKFREHTNKEELTQGVFICNQSGIEQVHTKTLSDVKKDIIEYFQFNLFEANKVITLDGVSYNVRVIAPNVDTFIQLNNPNTMDWREWEQKVQKLAGELANESDNQNLIDLFNLKK
jgi:hypothetical protein